MAGLRIAVLGTPGRSWALLGVSGCSWAVLGGSGGNVFVIFLRDYCFVCASMMLFLFGGNLCLLLL